MGYGQKVSGQKVLCIPGQKVLGIGQKVFHMYFYICICIIYMCTNMNFILVIFIEFLQSLWLHWYLFFGFTAFFHLQSQKKTIMN